MALLQPLKTCREWGFPGEEFADLLFAGKFDRSLRDRADLAALVHIIKETFSDRCFVLVERKNPATGTVVEMYLLVANDALLAEFVLSQLQVAANGEHISEEIFWDMVDPLLGKMWREAALSERIRLVIDAGAPAEAVMLDDVHPDVGTLLYRDLDGEHPDDT